MGRFITLFALATVVVGFLDSTRRWYVESSIFLSFNWQTWDTYIYIYILYIYIIYICIFIIYIYHMCVCIILVLYNYTNTFILYFAEHCKTVSTRVDFNKGYCQRVGCLDVWGLDVPELPETCDDDCALSLRQLRGQQFEAKVGKHGDGRGGGLEPLFSPKGWFHDDYQKRNSYELWSRKNAGVECGHFCNHWPFVQLREQQQIKERNQAPTSNFLMI